MNVLHIVLRHPSNSHPKYRNQWLDEWNIKSIVTYSEIAALCRPLMESRAPVRVHRATCLSSPAVVCCQAQVCAVEPVGTLYTVEFSGSVRLDVRPSVRPNGSKSYYYADCPEPAQAGHLELLARGIDAWNFARRSKPEVQPSLRGADLRPTLKDKRMVVLNLAQADLREANLSALDLFNPIFIQTSLRRANLEGSHWTSANIEGPESITARVAERLAPNFKAAVLDGADLSASKLDKACLYGADFCQSNLKSANFSGSTLRGLRFDGADLRGANFRDSDLTDACLEGADLRGTDLTTTVVTREQVAKATTDNTTRLPVDWDF